jgi:hypothetical protein
MPRVTGASDAGAAAKAWADRATAGRQAPAATAAEEVRKERREWRSAEIFTPPSYARRWAVVEGLCRGMG